MIGHQTAESLESLYGNKDAWTALKLQKSSKVFTNSTILSINSSNLLSKSKCLVVLHRFHDDICFIFKIENNQFISLPALFKLQSNISLVEPINDVGVLLELEAWANASGKFTLPLWILK
jgi:CBS domain containing-hemolysin-like protein